ncbi:hypothetical protein QUC31_005297 [Theobroma cacao]
MKLKINKACDLSSISVLPPHTRRSSLVPSGPQSSQLRSQPSQQSFSQGISSQHALFSQISQSSLDEVVTTDQRYGSQERENSVKKFSCLPPTNFTREDSQIPISKTSTNLIRKWNSASNPEHRCQSSQELEHRLSMVETSLNRFGMILDSIQSDVMQVNKGTKEVLLEMERIRQKLIAEDTFLQLLGIASNVKTLGQKGPVGTSLQPKCTSCATPQSKPQPVMKQAVPPKVYEQPTLAPKVETGGWKSVKMKQSTINERAFCKENKRKGVSSIEQEKYRILIESDEEMDGGFSCLLDDKETSIH